jgi:hypothetical protein
VYEKYTTDIDSITCDTADIHRVTGLDNWFNQDSWERYTNLKYALSYTLVRNHTLTVGMEGRYKTHGLSEKRWTVGWGDYSTWDLQQSGSAVQAFGFVNWNWLLSETVTSNAGLHSQYLSISRRATLEPRLSVAWKFTRDQSVSLGLGVHNQSLPLLLYYSAPGSQDLDFMRALHVVAGYT